MLALLPTLSCLQFVVCCDSPEHKRHLRLCNLDVSAVLLSSPWGIAPRLLLEPKLPIYELKRRFPNSASVKVKVQILPLERLAPAWARCEEPFSSGSGKELLGPDSAMLFGIPHC